MKEISKTGMFAEGIICGILFTYLLAYAHFDIPIYPFCIGLVALVTVGLIMQEEKKE